MSKQCTQQHRMKERQVRQRTDLASLRAFELRLAHCVAALTASNALLAACTASPRAMVCDCVFAHDK